MKLEIIDTEDTILTEVEWDGAPHAGDMISIRALGYDFHIVLAITWTDYGANVRVKRLHKKEGQ